MPAPIPKPIPPEEPDALDCCGEGCVRCVYDVHDEAVAEYEELLAIWEAQVRSDQPDASSSKSADS